MDYSNFKYLGKLIKTSDGKVMIVHKVKQVNFLCYDELGRAWNVRINGQEILPADTPFNRTAYDAAMKRERDRSMDTFTKSMNSPLTLGSVVELTGLRNASKFPGKYVVLGLPSRNGTVRVAKLGGDGGRYVSAPLEGLKQVEL